MSFPFSQQITSEMLCVVLDPPPICERGEFELVQWRL